MNEEAEQAREKVVHDDTTYLQRLSQDMRVVRNLLTEAIAYMKDAESEIPEKTRRFMMYFHDVHDIFYLYTQTGQEPPKHIKQEIERCHDRYVHILDDMYSDMGAFERVRQEMAERKGNRYDHTRQVTYETRNREQSERSAAAKEQGEGD
jgi:hypothetical protein